VVTRSGFVALAGRPNVGKSTLVNAFVGRKVAIVSDKPQTTRRAIRGVVTTEDAQLVLVDLPGVQRPRDPLTQRMQSRVEREVAEDDAVLFVVNGVEGIGPGDRWIATLLAEAGVPVLIAVNKVDRLSKAQIAEVLVEAASLDVGDEVFPVAARTGAGVRPLLDAMLGLLPEGPFFFPPEAPTDQPVEVLLAELIREEVLKRTFQEVPHAVEVVVEELSRERDDLAVVVARIWTEAESQKGILIGKGGRMIKTVGTAARRALEQELGVQVHLELSVDVRRHWRADERLLDRLGIE
jgi:GTP-binding protein Era